MECLDALSLVDTFFLACKVDNGRLAHAAKKRLEGIELKDWPKRLAARPDCEADALEELVWLKNDMREVSLFH